MAEETLQLVPYDTFSGQLWPYVVDFNGLRLKTVDIRYRLGRNSMGGPVAQKIALTDAGRDRLRRELDVARYLGPNRGGDLLSKCVGGNFTVKQPYVVVSYRGTPLKQIAADRTRWPLSHASRSKLITDLLRGLELLWISCVVHGRIGLDTLYWDGDTLQITDFSRAALSGKFPDGAAAHHADDIEAVGRAIYQVYTGEAPPADPAELRRQLTDVHGAGLRDLLLRRDLIADTDIDYVFAADRAARPTVRDLLNRLETRPRGIQWKKIVAADQAARAAFAQLRERQAEFRAAYEPWVAERRRPPRPGPPRPGGPRPGPSRPPQAQYPVRAERRGRRLWLVLVLPACAALVAGIVIVLIVVGVL